MKNIIAFVRAYFNFLVFLALQVYCIVLITKHSKPHEVYYGGVASSITGNINAKVSSVYNYFGLNEVNKSLAAENARLKDSLRSSKLNMNSPVVMGDSIWKATHSADTTSNMPQKYHYLPALIVRNDINSQFNFLTLEIGSKQGAYKGMGVVGPDGIVGEVVDVNNNYAVVMSLLHRKSIVSAMLKKDKNTGTIEWDGVDPTILTLRNIPKSAKVTKGDTVVTSTYSSIYPPYLSIGYIESVKPDNSSNFYILKVKTATNFFNIQHAYAISNYRYAEQKSIEQSKQKLNE